MVGTVTQPKAAILLGTLLGGGSIQHGGQTFVMDVDNNLCVMAEKITGDKRIPVALKVSFGSLELPQFICWAESFSDDEIIILLAERVLNNEDQPRRK